MTAVNLVTPKFQSFITGSKGHLVHTLSMKIPNKSFGDIFVKSDVVQPKIDVFETRILCSNGRKLGYEEFIMNTNDNIEGLYIETEKEFKNKGGRIGELLRLTSIIEFLENKKKNFNIYSKETAIMFHTKYKFEPNITQFTQRNKMLETIIENNNCKDEKLIERAKNIYKDIIKGTIDSEKQRLLCKQTNEITKDYIEYLQKNVDNPKDCNFHYGINMILTREKVLENKDFFNQLFKNHGINYTIQ